MTYMKKASFAFGELDPSLHDKTDSQSYYAGLKTAVNVLVNKTGRIINAPGTWFGSLTKNNTNVRIYVSTQPQDSLKTGTPGYKNYILEFGVGYVRAYNIIEPIKDQIEGTISGFDLQLLNELATDYTAADLPKLKFQNFREKDNTSDVTYVACEGYRLQRLVVVNDVLSSNAVTGTYNGVGQEYPTTQEVSAGSCKYTDKVKFNAAIDAQLGHFVEYGFTVVTSNGIESPVRSVSFYFDVGNVALTNTYPRLPTNDESNSFYIEGVTIWDTVTPNAPAVQFSKKIKYINIYRRPVSPSSGRPTGRKSDNNSWGLIGQADSRGALSGALSTDGVAFSFAFIDFGQEADYTNPPPESFQTFGEKIVDSTNVLDLTNGNTIASSFSKLKPTGLSVYNNRLLMWKDNLIAFSKINYPRYLLRDFPLTEATALTLEIGQKNPTILHAVDSSGLYVFTTEGIYFGGAQDAVSGVNPILKRINESVADRDVAPIVTPYGMFFVDVSTNSIKTLMYDDVAKSVIAEDVSTASDHIFYGKKVVSWAFHGGEVPHLFVILDDGTAASYSYSKSSGLNAWTRHTTDGLYKEVISYKSWDTSKSYMLFVVYRNGNYVIERSSIRALTDPQDYRSFSHSSRLFYSTYDINVPPVYRYPSRGTWTVVAGVDTLWENTVRITSSVGSYWDTRVGKTFAAYVSSTDSYYYMTVASVVSMTSVTFTITGQAYPVELRGIATQLTECHTVITGLTHLNGKTVSVYSDNAVVGSPFNDAEVYDTFTVSSGQITLPTPRAYSVVGLPYVSDIETLEIDTRNGTTALDKKIVNEVGVRYARTRGVYVSGELPANNSVVDMENAEDWTSEDVVNRPIIEKTGLKVYRPTSTWNGKGKIALRQVDPLPFEVTSIILDVSKG